MATIALLACALLTSFVVSLPAAASSTSITLERCVNSTAYPQVAWTLNADGSISAADGTCLGFASSSNSAPAVTSPCGASPDTFTFHPDGTVSSSKTGLCLNADAGSTSAGTSIIAYTCGVNPRAVAANAVFAYDAAARHIFANESQLCVSTSAVPPPPPPDGTCETALDCTLSGECVAGKCVCYKPWTAAPDCSAMAFLPAPVERGFPPPGHNETTWGGSVALDPVGGKYHMFVAEMMNECPLNTWGQNSRCTHAVADTPVGPYLFSDVAVQNWCHNPAIILTKDASTGAPVWALFHIGDGTGGSTKNCTATRAEAAVGHAAVSSASGSTLHTAPTPNGPWTPASPLGSCNNPAPFLHNNGTVYIVCDGFRLYRGDSFTAAGTTWTQVGPQISASGTPIAGNYEDPFLYIDARGNWHILYHVYRTGPVGGDEHNCLPGHSGAVVSGHYFSEDGLKWYTSPTMPVRALSRRVQC